MTRKRTIIILLIIALLLGGAAFYLIYFKKLPALPFGLSGGQTTQETPVAGGGFVSSEKLRRVSTEGAVSPILAADGAHIRYLGKNGDVFDVGFDGVLAQQTPFIPLQRLAKVFWNKDRGTFAAAYGSAEGKKFFYYDLLNKKMSPYPNTVTALALSETEDKLVYHSAAGLADTPLIAVADLDGSNAKTILQARVRGVDLSWTSSSEVSVSTIPSGVAPGMLWLLNTASAKLSTVLSDIYGLTIRWTPSKEAFLFSQTNAQGKGLTLSLANKNASSVKTIASATLPEKCVFAHDEKSILCAIPQVMPDIVWPDDYYKKVYDASEQLWRIDLASGKKDLLYEFGGPTFDASELILSPDEDALMFVNRKDGELYRLQLK